MILSFNKKVTKKVTKKMQEHCDIVLNFMVPEKEYRLNEIATILGVKETRTKTILKYLMDQGKLKTIGITKGKRYKLK